MIIWRPLSLFLEDMEDRLYSGEELHVLQLLLSVKCFNHYILEWQLTDQHANRRCCYSQFLSKLEQLLDITALAYI